MANQLHCTSRLQPLLHPYSPCLLSPPMKLYYCIPPILKLSVTATPHSLSKSIVCMANPRRVKMVAKQIQRELSDMLLTDRVLQCAILPEAALGADRYLSSLTTISDVQVSGDLQVVKVYVSVFGDEKGREVAMAGLKSKTKYVRSELGRRMKLRLTPEIRFIEDESLERGSRVIAILDRIKTENLKVDDANRYDNNDDDDQDDERKYNSSLSYEEDVEDPDQGVIYVK